MVACYNNVITLNGNKGYAMEIATEIKRVRQLSMLSQEEMARELGVSFATVNRWETGKAKPTYRTLRLIDEFCQKRGINSNIASVMAQQNGG